MSGLSLAAAGLLSSYVVHMSHCSGFSCCRAWAVGRVGSVAVAPRLCSTASIVVAFGLGCSVACGLVPDQRSNPCPLHWQADS